MGLEHRNGRVYYYRSRRGGGRVRREYVAAGEAAAMVATWDELDRDRRDSAAWERAALLRRADEVLAAGAGFEQLAERVFRAAMHLTGHALHNRAEWRRTRGVRPMATLHDLGKPPRNSTANRDAPAELDAETRAALDAAGPGGAAALAVVGELLQDPKQADALGYAALTARATLVTLHGAKDAQLATELARQCERQTKALLADSGPEPSLPEWMAAARVVNNWLTVHALEAAAAGHALAGASAGALDRRLTQAEKRLHASLKSLAVLRRLRQPVAVTQVNVAKGGPLIVNNIAPEAP